MSAKLSDCAGVPLWEGVATRQVVLASVIIVQLLSACSGTVDEGSGVGDDDGEQGGNGGGGPISSSRRCAGQPSVSAGRWRRLTAEQYANTVRDLLGEKPSTAAFVADTRTGPFKANTLLPVQENDVGAYDTLAQSVAAKAVADLGSLLGCDVKTTGEEKCAAQFIKSFGARAYRRPLTPDEEKAFATVYSVGKQESFSLGIRSVVEAALSSPNFLYMVEIGTPGEDGLRKLTGFEMATRLSYVLTGTMPDADLLSEAAKGSLATANGVREYAKKLLASEKFDATVQGFHTELLGVDGLQGPSVSKDAKYASFNDDMRAAMADEPARFVTYLMKNGQGNVKELMSAPYVVPTGPLGKIYGDAVVSTSDGIGKVNDGTRKGILTLASVLAAHPKAPSPRAAVARGNMVRQSFLCETVPAPTVMVDFSLPPNAAQMTAQELLREHQANPSCKGCHELMDSIGFGFEKYDPIGAHREKDEGGNAIDSSGEIVNLATNGQFADASEMADTLAEAPEVRLCMSEQWLRFALGRDPQSDDDCSLSVVDDVFLKGHGDIKQAILALVTSDSFRLYRGQ